MRDVYAELSAHPFVQGIPPEQLAAFAPLVEPVELPPGETFIHKGADTRDFYLLIRGRAEAYLPKGEGEEDDISLNICEAGDSVGELSFFDGSPPGASGRVMDTPLQMLRFDHTAFSAQSDPAVQKAIFTIGFRTATNRAREQSGLHNAQLEAALAAAELRTRFGKFFVYNVAAFTIAALINAWLSTRPDFDMYSTTFAWVYVLIMLVPAAAVVWWMGVSLDEVGLGRRDFKKSAVEGVIASLLAGVLFAVVLFVLAQFGITFEQTNPDLQFRWATIYMAPIYLFHAGLQEFFARGLLQRSLQRFFDDEKGWQSVILASILFAITHVHFGVPVMIMVAGISLFYGAFYLRHESLIGVTILHWATGTMAISAGLMG